MQSLKEIAKILGCEVEEKDIKGFAIDSRNVKRGELFFALKGEKFDGHTFLREVASKGAVAAVVEKGYVGQKYGMELLPAEDVTAALQCLAQEVQKRRKSRVVGVTGSVGKTTTKEFIAHLLAGKFKVAKTPGNANSQAGLPLSLLNGEGGEEVLVAELGMNHAGEMAKLMAIVHPEIGVITHIGRAHAGNFSDGILGIVHEKAEILRGAKVGIVHPHALQYKEVTNKGCRLVTFDIAEVPKGLALPFAESHLKANFACAAQVALEMGLTWEEIGLRALGLKPFDLRFEKIEKNGVTFINDCYNSNPEAVQAALENLPRPKRGGKVVAVLGEMAELGKYSEEAHREIGVIAADRVDHLLCYGKETLPVVEIVQKLGKIAEFFTDVGRLRDSLWELAREGDVVLIKGKNTNKLWQILESID